MKRPAIFLDRDGTLIEEVNYLSRVEDLRLFPFSADAVSSTYLNHPEFFGARRSIQAGLRVSF